LSCLLTDCTPFINATGGGGAGGYLRVEASLSTFYGTISATSGCGSSSRYNYIGASKGYVISSAEMVQLNYSISDVGLECVDIHILTLPAYMVQTIYTSGSGLGNNSAIGTAAVIRGTWTASYRSRMTASLSASASAAEVKAALETIGTGHVTVHKIPNGISGWAWQMTFYDIQSRVSPISVDGNAIYSTNGDAKLASNITFPPTIDNGTAGYDYAYASYNYSELVGLVNFSYPILGPGSSAFWLNTLTLRVLPTNYTCVSSLVQLVGKLQLLYIFPFQTLQGLVQGINYNSKLA
jgi:hypothetical protein